MDIINSNKIILKVRSCFLIIMPPSTKIETRLERSGHDLKLIPKFQAWPYSNLTSSAKNKFTTETISIFVPG